MATTTNNNTISMELLLSQFDSITGVPSPQNIPQVDEEEEITPKEKILQRIQNKLKELINEEEILDELLTNPTLLGKRKWISRFEIGNFFGLNINEPEYEHINNEILDMYNNGMKKEHLETTNKYMMECVADYMMVMENIYKKTIEYYVLSIRASKLPEDDTYIKANYSQLHKLIDENYKNEDLSFKIRCISGNIEYSVASIRWDRGKITELPLNKTLIFISFIYEFIERKANSDLSNFRYNNVNLKEIFNKIRLTTDGITELMGLLDELGFPRNYIRESDAAKILAGKLALNLAKCDDCAICKEQQVKCVPINWVCGHYICVDCHNDIVEQEKCPICRFVFKL
jgi:hypothetical protein